MKDKKFLIFLVFSLTTVFLFSYYFGRPLKKIRNQIRLITRPKQENNISKLQQEIVQLKNLVVVLSESSKDLNFMVKQGNTRAAALEKNLEDAGLVKEQMSNELEQLRSSLILAKPIRDKLDQMEGDFDKNVEEQIKKQMEDLTKALGSVEKQIPTLIREKKSYRSQIEELVRSLEGKSNELASLEKELADYKNEMKNKEGVREKLSKDLNLAATELKLLYKAREGLEEKVKELEKNIKYFKGLSPTLKDDLEKAEKELRETQMGQIKIIREREEALRLSQQAQNELKEVSSALSSYEKKNKELESQLNAYKKELAGLNKERGLMLKAVDEAKQNSQNYQKAQGELEQLKIQVEQVSKDYSVIKEESKSVKDSLEQANLEQARRADRILVLQDKLAKTEDKLLEFQLKYKGIEKDAAGLREQYVVLQLERENLKKELARTAAKLNELQAKMQQVGSIFGIEAPGQGKKINVELIPQNETGVKNAQ
ncbi:MAG: hypothetical protein ABIG46_01760 [Candidatus Omnitrophota bacterium]|nr:hypothetical protein [Candidatus Omnitrophota bacterium]